MQRGVSAGARDAIPGIFETIAAAMSLLLVQPVLLALPLVVDLYLWLGARISPEQVLEPMLGVLSTQRSVEAEALTTSVRGLSEHGSLVELLGFFIPSLVGSVGAQNLAAPWPRAAVDPGGIWATLLLALGFGLLGAVCLMTLQVMMAQVIRGGPPLGAGVGRLIGVATLRYLGFLALLIPVVVLVVIASTLVASLMSMINVALASLVVLAVVVLAVAAVILLTFVVDAIALAEVGPTEAVELSAGVVRRYPWGSIGLLLVTGVSLVTLPELVRRIDTESVFVVLVTMILFAFVATGLALARMQFFADRLRQWRPGQVRPFG
jgi:hypothetical protein